MVFKARSLKHPTKLYALKKIIMHNEKDGVGCSSRGSGGIVEYYTIADATRPVPDYRPPRNQDLEAVITQERALVRGHGSGAPADAKASYVAVSQPQGYHAQSRSSHPGKK